MLRLNRIYYYEIMFLNSFYVIPKQHHVILLILGIYKTT